MFSFVLGKGGEEGENEEEEREEKEGDESGDDEITDLDVLLRKERQREKKKKVEDPQADEVYRIYNHPSSAQSILLKILF